MIGAMTSPDDLPDFQNRFQDMLLRGDLDQAYHEWSKFWEEWALRDLPPNVCRDRFRGRGQAAPMISAEPKPPRSVQENPSVAFFGNS